MNVVVPPSKAWNWAEKQSAIWLNPSEECFFIAHRWRNAGYQHLLDFGCGLGRHSIFFAKKGFHVSAFDLSVDGVNHLKRWAMSENLKIDAQVANMLSLPYAEQSFDCLFAYHVISHTDTDGLDMIMREIKRVVKPGGEVYMTLCSKETWAFAEAGFPKIDANTVRKTEDGPEKDIPHFHVDLEDIIELFSRFDMELLRVRHADDCYFDGQTRNSKHYFILAHNAPL